MRCGVRLAAVVLWLGGLGAAASVPAADKEKGQPGSDTEVTKEDLAAAKPILVLNAGGHTAPVRKVLFTPDGKQVITISHDNTVRFWDVETGQTVRVLRPPIGPKAAGGLTAGAISPDGKTLAVAGWGHLENGERVCGIYLFSLPKGTMRTHKGHTDSVECLAFSYNGKRLASGSEDRTARIWDTASGECLKTLEGHEGTVSEVAFGPRGRKLATGSWDRTARTWTVASGKEEAVLKGHQGFVVALAWSPDAQTLVTAGRQDRAVRMWDNDGTERGTLALEDGTAVQDLAFKGKESGKVLCTWRRAAHGLAGQARPRRAGDLLRGGAVRQDAVPARRHPAPAVARAGGGGRHEGGKQAVASMQLLLDGRPFPGALKAVKEAKAGETVKENWKIQVPEGEHSLRAVARTEAALGLSDDLEVHYEKPAPRPKLHVLAIGINEYKAKNLKLECAVNDATELEKTFRDRSKGLFDVQNPTLLTEKEARREGILKALLGLKDCMKPRDVAAIFCAGHGEQDGKGFYLLPQDVDVTDLKKTAISGDLLKQHLADLPGKVLLLLDACHSGKIGRAISDIARDLADEDCGVVVMCAALGSEKAGEADGHGFFCRAILEALRGERKAPRNARDGYVYLHHLEQYVIDRVGELSRDEQHPTSAKPTLRPLALAKP